MRARNDKSLLIEGDTKNTIEMDIALIKLNTDNFLRSFEEYKDTQCKIIDNQNIMIAKLGDRVTIVEISQAKMNEKQSAWSVFSTAFSIVASAIAAYLGVRN